MIGAVNINKNVMDVRKSAALSPYSKVVIIVDEDTEYTAGNDSGQTLEFECPWGTQAMAENILQSVLGFQYQPYTATTAIIDPAAEIGDAVNVNSVYGGLYQQETTFNKTFYCDLAAPEDEQLDHEYTYESPVERRIIRQKAWAKTEFRITNEAIRLEAAARESDKNEYNASLEAQAKEIRARVAQTGGTNSSFGWSLLSTAFILYANSKAVFTCNSNGIAVDGTITARSGYIGDGSSGFTIGSTYIKNGKNSPADKKAGVYLGTDGIGVGNGVFSVTTDGNLALKGKVTATSGYIGSDSNGFEIGSTFLRNGMTSYSDTTNDGVFIGTNGIALGKGNFKVDAAGNLYANNGTFNGTIKASKITGQIVNSQISDGAVGSSKIGNGAVGSAKISDGAVGSAKIGNGAVGSAKLSDSSVTSAKLGNNSVTSSKIKNSSVSKSKTDSSVQTSLDNGDTAIASFNSLVAGSIVATSLRADRMYCDTIFIRGGESNQIQTSWQSKDVVTAVDFDNKSVTQKSIRYIGRITY